MAQVTICVPVYNGAAFVAETLDHIASQSFTDVKVLVSIDRGEDDSETICRRYLSDRRWDLVVQPERLGWVRNVNALIQRVDTPYFCIVPHDDLLDSRYVAEVYALASSDGAIACAYSDIKGFGTSCLRVEQPEIRGAPLERVADFFLNHFGAVAFRGLIRRRDPEDWPLLPTGLRRDFAADTVWMLTLALRGELRRVPEARYAKRYIETSVHSEWLRWSRSELLELWSEQAAVCARLALENFDDAQDRRIVLGAAIMRLTGASNPASFAAPQDPLQVAAVTVMFCEALKDILSPADLQEILSPQTVDRLYALSRHAWDHRAAPATIPQRVRRRLLRLLGRTR